MEQTPRYRATPHLGPVLKQQGRSKVWVAQTIKANPGHISNIVRRKRTLSGEHAERISQALGVPSFLLFELADASDTLAIKSTETSA